jgi:Tol biopolymer transport system component
LPAGTPTRLTFGTAINDRPEWTRDGTTIVYRSTEGAPRHGIWTVSVTGGDPTLLFGSSDSHIDEGVLSPDEKHLLVQRDRTSSGELWYTSLIGDSTFLPVVSGLGVYGGRFSPDGKWVVYTLTQSGPEQVYVKPFPSLTGQFQVSIAGGHSPVWSADGRRIYYANGEQLMAATIGSTQPFTIASRSVALSAVTASNRCTRTTMSRRTGRSSPSSPAGARSWSSSEPRCRAPRRVRGAPR